MLTNKARDQLKNQLKRHEGVKYELYCCTAGKQTIGVGRNLDDLGISDDEVMYLLDNDVSRVEQELLKNIPTLNGHSENRQIVLNNMAFNLGINRLMKFKSMLKALEAQDYQSAANEMLDSLWARQVGQRAEELAEMMRKG